MKTYNGISMMHWQKFGEPDAELTTDACILGRGATDASMLGDVGRPSPVSTSLSSFPTGCWIKQNINLLEYLVIIIATKLYRHKLRNKRIVVLCHNLVTVFVINTGRAKSRLACLLSATGGFEIKSQHLPGAQNRVADCKGTIGLDWIGFV